MKTTAIGQTAESVVAEHLANNGYKIVARNWKTKLCEIDVVAAKDDVMYFVEVKYRSSARQGGGLEHITKKKLNQIKFALRVWCQNHNWDGDCRILGAEVSGQECQNVVFTEID